MPEKLKPCPFCGGDVKIINAEELTINHHRSGGERVMATCKDCLHVKICQKTRIMDPTHNYAIECNDFKDRSRFVELQTAHWIRHSPDKNIMREFHKQGIGRGMGENSIFWTCSNCESWGNLSFKYCPSCGAKIEEAEAALKEREENEPIFKNHCEISEQD